MEALQFSILLFAAAIVGAILPLLGPKSARLLHLFLSLATGFFLGVVFLHLLPHVAEAAQETGSFPWVWMLVGLLAVLVIEFGFFGHRSHATVGWAMLIGLSAHALPAGLGLAFLLDEPSIWLLALSFCVHKFGASFSLASALRFSLERRRTVMLLMLAFALVTPAGLMLGASLGEHLSPEVEAIFAALSAGTFLYVAIGELLPEVFHGNEDRGWKMTLLLGGVAFAALTNPHLGHGHEHGGEEANLLVEFGHELLGFFIESAPYLLLGFFAAALIQVFVSKSWLARVLGGRNFRSVATASALGVPLPLCSCSVLPTAAGLRKQGASKGATVSFLVSTPETGVDSIAISYALLDPTMTIARPAAALVTAMAAGVATNLIDDGKDDGAADPASEMVPGSCDSDASMEDQGLADPSTSEPFSTRFRAAMRYAFVDIIDDIMPTLLIGFVLSAFLSVLLPSDFLASSWAQGPVGLFLALLVGIPVYICASSSTPVAAALILKGLSPGAALVFLLVGPATNLGSLLVLKKLLGTRILWTYLTIVAVLSLAFGFLLNVFYESAIVSKEALGAGVTHGEHGTIGILSAVLLGLLSLKSLDRLRRKKESCCS